MSRHLATKPVLDDLKVIEKGLSKAMHMVRERNLEEAEKTIRSLQRDVDELVETIRVVKEDR